MIKALELIVIPKGEFIMGSTREEVEEQIKNNSQVDKRLFERQFPQHRIYLGSYQISKYLITNGQFANFIEETGYKTISEREGWGFHFEGGMKKVEGANWRIPHGPNSDISGKENHPVVMVSWFDCLEYCKWLSAKTGGNWRLATEAGWEKAARGPVGNVWPWGDSWDEEKCNCNNLIEETTPVGKYSPLGDSFFGCADMAGNVLEWTSTTIGITEPWPARFNYPYKESDGREDLSLNARRVGRGGTYQRNKDFCRCAFRFADMPSDRYSSMGFRVVCDV